MEARKPAVSGTFYAGTPRKLEDEIEWCYKHELGPGAVPQVNSEGPRKIIALIVPHAGYIYSGPVASHAYKELADDGIFHTAVIRAMVQQSLCGQEILGRRPWAR